ncbi:MAG: type VI secretion system baseplate subunit TssK [Moraxellaceae bacterium]|nr:MAG: type VI secretion system baseplate subunit TssK [Moraxellaceae bacterium]
MVQANKVLWGEGLFLRPQHFQIQDLYHEQRLNQTIQALAAFPYGVRKLEFDTVQLQNNILALNHVDILWSDGDVYKAPEQDLLPENMQLDSTRMADQAIVYIAFPALHNGSSNLQSTNQIRPVRYSSKQVNRADIFTDAVESEVVILQRQGFFRVLDSHSRPDHELDGMLYFPVARIHKNSASEYEFDSNFMPPLLHVDSSELLLNTIKRLMGVIRAKIKLLQTNNREIDQQLVEFRSGDLVSFWLVNSLNAGYAAMNHIIQHPQIHPERLHQEMLRLAGSLLTFSRVHALDNLPVYNHNAPLQGFNLLDSMIREMLDTIISTRYLNISLRETKPSYWQGSLDSDKITRNSRLYLAINCSLPAHELVASIPVRIKVGAPDDVEKRVLAALPAISLTHLSNVPSAIPVRSGVLYFAVEPYGDLYEHMLQQQSVCIYIPGGFSDLTLELIAIIDS